MSEFNVETKKVIKHLKRRLLTLIDTSHSATVLKNVIVEYLEGLLEAGPLHIAIEETIHPHWPPDHSQSLYPDEDILLHGIHIPAHSEVIMLPSIRPHVVDFFFKDGNIRHFISVDNRPISDRDPSHRVHFHSTCPQEVSKQKCERRVTFHEPEMRWSSIDRHQINDKEAAQVSSLPGERNPTGAVGFSSSEEYAQSCDPKFNDVIQDRPDFFCNLCDDSIMQQICADEKSIRYEQCLRKKYETNEIDDLKLSREKVNGTDESSLLFEESLIRKYLKLRDWTELPKNKPLEKSHSSKISQTEQQPCERSNEIAEELLENPLRKSTPQMDQSPLKKEMKK